MLALLLTLIPQTPVTDLVHVPVRSAAELAALSAMLHDVDEHHPSLAAGYAIVYATDAEQAALFAAGIPFEIRIEDLSAWYAARAAADPLPRGGPVGSMGGFRTLAEIEQEMDRLAATFPLIVSPKFSVGTSIQGRPIWAMRISTTPAAHDPAKPVAWYDAIHHAREPMSGEAILRFADFLVSNYGADADATRIVATRNSLFIPCVNPDGYEFNRQIAPNGGGLWRKNRRNNGGGSFGVDLNRNYAWEWGPQWPGSSGNPDSDTYRGTAPFSEPETAALRDLLAQQTPGMSISCHTYSDLLLYSWGYNTIVTPDNGAFRQYGEDMTSENGWDYGTVWQLLYIANGGSIDWHYGQHGAFAFTPEIGSQTDGFWPSPSRIDALAADAHRPLLRTAQWTGGWAESLGEQWTETSGDGDTDLEPGETWSLAFSLQNGGVEAVAGTLDVVSGGPFAAVSGGPAALTLPARSLATSPAFSVAFAANAPGGASIPLDLVLDYDGHASALDVSVTLGGQRVLARDTMETDDFGWAANNATNWSWERANPEPTSTNGQTAQTGDDHTAVGTLCWVTGAAAGGSVGANDVDGVATLTSAPLNLAEFDNVELAYWRWFANDPGTGGDDRFLAEVSADGGANWTTLEDVGNDNAWREASFALENFIPLAGAVVIRFTVADDPNNDITEGLLDDLELRTRSIAPTLALYGPAQAGATAAFFVSGAADAAFDLAYSFTRTAGQQVGGIAGLLYLGSPYTLFASGIGDGEGLGSSLISFPPAAAGRTVHFQGVSGFGTPQAEFTNALTAVFP